MTYRIRNVGLAFALALVAGLMVTFYVTNYKKSVQADEETIQVWVASQDITEGTSGEKVIESGLLEKQEFARKNVAPGAITEPSQLAGTAATQAIYAGEQVSTLRFRPAEQRGVRAQLTGALRAVQVAGDKNQLLAGVVREGDHVDVIGNWKYPESGQEHITRVVLRDILVLKGAEAQSLSGPEIAAPEGSLSVLLALTDAQSQKLFFVARNGDWALALRPPEDATDSPEGVETAGTLLFDGLNRNQLRQIRIKEGSAQ
jgi:Flp pilus assembly protein CpaB